MATSQLPDYSGYQRLPNWVLGFHGCDEDVGRKVLTDPKVHLESSQNKWDWLGDGIYFWENDPERARQFAVKGMDGKITKGSIRKPFVIGAVIDLGLCLNMFDQVALQEMRVAAESLTRIYGSDPLPANKGAGRFLDRAVFEHLHKMREWVDYDRYQTTRAAFPEGAPLYPGTEFTEQNHIQIAVRDTSCIRGYFLPRL